MTADEHRTIHGETLKEFIRDAVHEAFALEGEQVEYNVQELHNAAASVVELGKRLRVIRHPDEYTAAADQYRAAFARLEAALEQLPAPDPCIHERQVDAPFQGPQEPQQQQQFVFNSLDDVIQALSDMGLSVVRFGPPGFGFPGR